MTPDSVAVEYGQNLGRQRLAEGVLRAWVETAKLQRGTGSLLAALKLAESASMLGFSALSASEKSQLDALLSAAGFSGLSRRDKDAAYAAASSACAQVLALDVRDRVAGFEGLISGLVSRVNAQTFSQEVSQGADPRDAAYLTPHCDIQRWRSWPEIQGLDVERDTLLLLGYTGDV